MNRPRGYQTFFAELKRRRVFRVAAVYGVVAFVVLQAAEIVLPSLLLPDWTLTLLVVLTIAGFPIALVLAWAFDVTPEGVRRTDAATVGELDAIAAQPRSRRWPAGLLALAGALLLGAGGWWALARGLPGSDAREAAADGPADRSIAVLPFVNMSADRENEYFSDGLAEELINVLGEIDGLKVAARTSAFTFKGRNADVREIGDALGVANVLEGSVRKSGDRVRITAQLVRASNGFHLWSATYDRDLTDIFAIQEQIAGAIARQLELTLGPEDQRAIDRRRTDDLTAYDLYLLGRHRWAGRTDRGLVEAREYLEAAVERDPSFAAAWAGLADVYDALPWYTDFPQSEALAKGKAAALRALELDPRLGEAHAALAVLVFEYEFDWATAETHFRRAIELAPNYAIAHDWYCWFLFSMDRFDEAAEGCERSVELDPLAMHTNWALACLHAYAGRLDRALPVFERVESIEPDLPDPVWDHGTFLAHAGRYDEAARVLERWLRIEGAPRPERAGEIVAGMSDPSERAEALRVVERLRSESRIAPYYWGPVYAALDVEAALGLLEELLDQRHPHLTQIGTDPRYDGLRAEPRFRRIIEALRLPNGGPTYRARADRVARSSG